MGKQEMVSRTIEYFSKEPDEAYKNWAILYYSQEENYTCSMCTDSKTCKYAWDFYNTGGDCLASK